MQDNLALPKYTAPVVGKFLKPLCSAYNELVTAYHSNSSAELRAVVTKHQEAFSADSNLGLVNQVPQSTLVSCNAISRVTVLLNLLIYIFYDFVHTV